MTARDATTDADPTDAVGTDAPATEPDATEPVTDGRAATAADPDTAATAAADADAEADPTAAPADEDTAPADKAASKADKAAAKAEKRARRRSAPHRAAADGDAPARPRRRWPLVALLVVAALFAGAMVGLYVTTRPDPIAGLTSSQQDAVTAAGQAAVNLQTFRRASFDEDFANALASLTPQFAQEQLAPRKDALQKQLNDGGRDATARALSSALVSATATQAVVLVVTNTTQTADNGTSTPFVFSRLQLTLQLVDGKWLVSDLKSVGLS